MIRRYRQDIGGIVLIQLRDFIQCVNETMIGSKVGGAGGKKAALTRSLDPICRREDPFLKPMLMTQRVIYISCVYSLKIIAVCCKVQQ